MRLMITALLFAFSLSATANTKMDCSDEKNFKEVSKAEVKALIKKAENSPGTVTIVDVNSEDTYKKNKVTGAVNYYEHEKTFAEVLPKDKDKGVVVAYCGGPSCGAWKKAAKAACEQGYTHIVHYKGGISGWMKN